MLLTEWNKPEERVIAENDVQIAAEAQIVRLLGVKSVVIFVTLLAELNGSELTRNQVDMEEEECCEDETKNTGQDVGSHDEVGDFVVK